MIKHGMEKLMNVSELVNAISNGALDERFRELYGSSERTLLRQRARYLSATENFSRLYPERGEIHVFSAPGRTETTPIISTAVRSRRQ